MKKMLLFLCLALLAMSCATQKQTISNAACPVYYNGNGEQSASSGVVSYSEEQRKTN
jgi:hypothetical protein